MRSQASAEIRNVTPRYLGKLAAPHFTLRHLVELAPPHPALPCAATNYAALDGRDGSAEEAALRREWARHEAVMAAIAEPSSQVRTVCCFPYCVI